MLTDSSPLVPEDAKHPILNLPLGCNSHAVPSTSSEGDSQSSQKVLQLAPEIKKVQNSAVRHVQPVDSVVSILPPSIITEVFQHVDQYDLLNLLTTCTALYSLATDRLYKRVTVLLNAEFPLRFSTARDYVLENGIRYMDSSIILTLDSLVKFLSTMNSRPDLIQKIKFFVFDKCQNLEKIDVNAVQLNIIEFFGANARELNFLHITFVDFLTGIVKLTNFLRNANIRNKIFKLFVTKTSELYEPCIPPSLTNLFLMLNEVELIDQEYLFDLSKHPYDVFNSLFTLTCSTNHQVGLEILRKFKLFAPGMKLKLKALSLFHCHKEAVEGRSEFTDEYASQFSLLNQDNDKVLLEKYMQQISKKLDFSVIDEKVEVANLTHLYLKVECIEQRHSQCNCFETFFKDLTKYSESHGGLPNLVNLEVESFPNLDWLRPHQILEDILTPLGGFVKTLNNLTRLAIDFSTPGFKMFDNNMGMSTWLLNKLNESLMESFFLCFFTASNKLNLVANLKTLQLPDFLTSFIYYKPDFLESLLHTCQCWGCALVLEKLAESFYPIFNDQDDDDLDEERDETATLDLESTYYVLIGYILGKLQADREVCIPIKEKTFSYRNYPIFKGQPHTLHNGFHKATGDQNGADACSCAVDEDPQGRSSMNIDNLVCTYIVHQLEPIIQYLSNIFTNLDNLMIHGIYYEIDKYNDKLVPIFDSSEYPAQFLENKKDEMDRGVKPSGPFGYFRNC